VKKQPELTDHSSKTQKKIEERGKRDLGPEWEKRGGVGGKAEKRARKNREKRRRGVDGRPVKELIIISTKKGLGVNMEGDGMGLKYEKKKTRDYGKNGEGEKRVIKEKKQNQRTPLKAGDWC